MLLHSSWALALATLVRAAPTAASDVLTPKNFNDTIATGVWFIEHFSPYCPHCRNFEPTWNDVVAHFEAMSDPGIHLAQVNCALNGDLCNENGVTKYPQMNLYRNGDFVEEYDERDFDLLVEFLAKHAEPNGTSQQVPAQTPTPITQEDVPTPTPTPTVGLVVQTPRSDVNPSGTVVSLDVQTFDSFLAQGPAFVKFFAPWCGHCKKLAPAWTQLGRRMQHKLNVAEVDCEQHKALCTSQGVAGYPMMFYYAHGIRTEYEGERSYDQLVLFANRASAATMQVIDAPQLEAIVRDNAVLYLLLHDASDHRVVDDIAKSTQFLLGVPPVYVSTSSELFRKYDIPPNTPSALLAFKDKDARQPVAVFYPTSSEFAEDALKTWLHIHRFPSSFELSKEVFQQVMFAPHRPLVVVASTPRGQEGPVSDKLREIAQKWRLRRARKVVGTGREVVFTWMDAVQWGKWMRDMYGIKAVTEPEIIVADHERLLYYNKDGTGHAIVLNSVSVASALEAILDGTARPRHSQSVLQRGVHSLNAALVRLQTSIAAHPYVTVLAVLGLIAAVFLAVRRLLEDEPTSWEKRNASSKGGRLD